MDTNTVQFLLEQKLETLRATNEVSMTWWVSSTLLSATILGTIWQQKSKIAKMPERFHKVLIPMLHYFFFSIIVYGGAICAYYHWSLRPDISSLMSRIDTESGEMFAPEINVSIVAILNGMTSFVIALICWHKLWHQIQELRRHRKDSLAPPP